MIASNLSEWAVCQACSQNIELPSVADALLDENGRAHVLCRICGSDNLVPYLPPMIAAKRRARWRGIPSYSSVVFMLVAIGLVLLLLPAIVRIHVEPPPNPLTLT